MRRLTEIKGGSDMIDDRIIYDYHHWLVRFVDNNNEELWKNYSLLMQKLFEIDYIWEHEWDEGRFLDGRKLRVDYDEDILESDDGVQVRLSPDHVSVLEVLVALCTRYSDEVLFMPDHPSVAPEIFYVILDNLNLIWCYDAQFDADFVEKSVQKWLKRTRKTTIFGEKASKKTDLWGECGTFCNKKYVQNSEFFV